MGAEVFTRGEKRGPLETLLSGRFGEIWLQLVAQGGKVYSRTPIQFTPACFQAL